jgi:hypothetical protein
VITTSADEVDEHPSALVTTKLYVPAVRPETVVTVPVPFVVTAPGLRINVHVPDEGNPLSTTLPVETTQVRLVIFPIAGADGNAFTVRVKVPVAAAQGAPRGLFVVMVMITAFPPSANDGV